MSAILHQALLAAYPAAGGGGPSDPDFANVSLLLHFDGANGSTTFIDSSGTPKTVTPSAQAQISTAQSKFGGSSGFFDGNLDQLTLQTGSYLAFGTSDFTIETFAYITANADENEIFNQGAGGLRIVVRASSAGTTLRLQNAANGTVIVTGTNAVSINQWVHIAVCRSGTTLRTFIDGIQESSVTNSTNFSSTSATIGYSTALASNTAFTGYMDEYRITTGVARYTANFTPTAAQFPDS